MQEPVVSKRTLTVDEFKAVAGTRETTTRRLIREGTLPVLRVGRRILITRDTLEKFLRGELDTSASASR